MYQPEIVALCHGSPQACWSTQHRCFEGRRSQIFVLATHVLGSRKSAARWLSDPAFGLGRQAPCDLMQSAAGYASITTLLMRIEYGVYT